MKIGTVLVAAISIIALVGFGESCGNNWAPVAGPALWLLSAYTSIFIHECGHVLAAKLAGWDVVTFSAGWLGYQARTGQIVISRKMKLRDFGGWVFAVPSCLENSSRLRFVFLAAGGPTASLAQFAGAIVLSAWAFGPDRILHLRLDYVAIAFAYQGLAVFVATAVPGIMTRKNDADQIIENVRLWQKAQLLSTAAFMVTMLQNKVRLRDLPSWMLDDTRRHFELSHTEDPLWTRWWRSLEIGRALDQPLVDITEVRAQIDQFWIDFTADDWLKACDIILAAVYERDLARAEALAKELTDQGDVPPLVFAAQAAIAMLRGDRASATACLTLMDAKVRQGSPFSDLTFRDIRAQIEGVRPLPACPSYAAR